MPDPIRIDYRIPPGQTVRIRVTNSLYLSGQPACGGFTGTLIVDPNGWYLWDVGYTPPSRPIEEWNGFGEWNLRAFLVDSTVTVTSATPNPQNWSVGIQQWAGTQAGGPWVRYASNTYTDRSVYVWVGRTGELDWYCISGDQKFPSTLISGSQTITVEPVLLNVTASKYEYDSGETVQFSVETDLTAAGVTWTYRYSAGGSVSVPACDGQLACALAPSGTGRMEVQLLESTSSISVTTQSAEVVQRPPCPPVPSWAPELNDPVFRNSLNTLYFTAIGLHLEQGGYRLRNDATGRDTVVNATKEADDCRIWQFDETKRSIPGYTPVGQGDIHVHIYPPGSRTPRSCSVTAYLNEEPLPFGGHMVDWARATGTAGRDYIIDDRAVHIFDDTDPPSDRIIVRPPIKWPAQCRVLLPVP